MKTSSHITPIFKKKVQLGSSNRIYRFFKRFSALNSRARPSVSPVPPSGRQSTPQGPPRKRKTGIPTRPSPHTTRVSMPRGNLICLVLIGVVRKRRQPNSSRPAMRWRTPVFRFPPKSPMPILISGCYSPISTLRSPTSIFRRSPRKLPRQKGRAG